MGASWARCVGPPPPMIRSRNARGPDTHLPLPARWRIMEKGVHNYLESLPQGAADSGEVMLTFGGGRVDGLPGVHRHARIVSGVCYSPKVFDITKQEFSTLRVTPPAHPATMPWRVH
eukprot:3581273-Pyramimonas_sp.AAC.1